MVLEISEYNLVNVENNFQTLIFRYFGYKKKHFDIIIELLNIVLSNIKFIRFFNYI